METKKAFLAPQQNQKQAFNFWVEGEERLQIRKEQRLEIERNVISQINSLSSPKIPSIEEACKLTVELTIDKWEDFKCKN